MHFIDFISDKDIKIAQILKKVGDKMLYTYDLGDQWEHIIELQEIKSEAESLGKSKVIDGAMACPPEDSCGLKFKGCNSYQCDILSHIGPLPRSTIEEIVTATNVIGRSFDPHAFNLSFTNQRVVDAIAGKASVTGGEMRFAHSLMPGSIPGAPEVPSGSGITHESYPMDPTLTSFMQQSVRTRGKDPKSERVCARCGNPNGLKACGRCRMVFYCSRECQNMSWSDHKQECIKISASVNARKLAENRISLA